MQTYLCASIATTDDRAAIAERMAELKRLGYRNICVLTFTKDCQRQQTKATDADVGYVTGDKRYSVRAKLAANLAQTKFYVYLEEVTI